VACLYCGKEIGPIRILKDREFCTSAHRQRYHNRLGKALGQLSEPEKPPAGIAAFRVAFPIQEGNSRSLCAAAQFGYLMPEPRTPQAWPISAAPTLAGSLHQGVRLPWFVKPPAAGAALSLTVAAELRMPQFELAAMDEIADADEPTAPVEPPMCADWLPTAAAEAAEPPAAGAALSLTVAAELRKPRFELAAMGEIADADEAMAPVAPPMCEDWLPTAAAEAAERFVSASLAGVQAFPSRHFEPSMSAVGLAGCYIRTVETVAETPTPEPVAMYVAPVMDSRPALRVAPPAHLRFTLHAVEDVAPAAKAPPEPMPVGLPLPAAAVAEAVAVESMPRIPALAVSAIAPVPAMRMPALKPLARPLVLAGTVAPPPAVAVETMPSVEMAEPRPMTARMALRKPTLAHFQMAAEASSALAAPAAAAPPMAVESLPCAPAFEARPAVAPPVLMRQGLEAPVHAEFALGSFHEATQPAVVAPLARTFRKPVLQPLARIESQLSATQPERPKPAIPEPAMFALEYYCHRITNEPKVNLEWREGKVDLLLQPFRVKPSLVPFAEYAGKSRKLLAFEEIFAQQKEEGEPARVKLSTLGKIAATIMVGVALWGGSRLAGLGDSLGLQARVASSERTVTAVAEVRSEAKNGTMAKIRRAIADRASTEVTDTFTSGMEAWGAGAQTWVPGWQRSASGYVKTGEMALFQPSLNYTDYHMEFYGQIEEKSMGWVVRAKDKQNYYAMKFKVIEPGLRPIIAMEHYQVVNGKRGRTEQTPLSVMVHNNEPYHVSVDVRGNRFMAAIEGEPVDSWVDDAPKKGGVGFFSEKGERARLYWMKIARNQDWLGRFCAYLSGDSASGQQTAELWGPEPGPVPAPAPVNPRSRELALAVAGATEGIGSSPRRARTSKDRRRGQWIS
jgi:hypothetical protein